MSHIHSVLGPVGAELLVAVPIIPPADCSSQALGAASRWLINCNTCTQTANPVSRCCVFKEFLSHLQRTTKSLLLSNSCWGFSRKKDRETLEDFRVDLHYNSADGAEAEHSFDSHAQTQTHPGAPGLNVWGFKCQPCKRGSAALLAPPSCG